MRGLSGLGLAVPERVSVGRDRGAVEADVVQSRGRAARGGVLSVTEVTRLKILASNQLPSMPAIAVQVLEMAQRAEVDLGEIATTISRDPALSARILKTVNSSFYGRSHAVSTVSHALVILGLQAVKTLVLGFSLVPTLSKEKTRGFDHVAYWRRSIYAATAARMLAARVGAKDQQEEAFLATLLADVGMLVLDRVLEKEYADVVAAAGPSHACLSDAERAAMKFDHAEVAQLLAEQWKLPPILTEPIAFHHAEAKASAPALVRLAQVVGVAGRCADVFVDADGGTAANAARVDLERCFKINAADADALLADIGVATREVASLFEINLGKPIDLEAVLKQANETLVEFTLASQQKACVLAEQNAALTVRATVDRLTGLANRSRFDEVLAERFAQAAVAGGAPLSLVMIDVDKFKNVNDQHGHDAGDVVLKRMGAMLAAAARAGTPDVAARYGGEEMALILPATDRATAAHMAERLRHAIASSPVHAGTLSLRVTISLGVATIEPGSPFRVPAHLIKAADLAMYKAKHSGRNNVKVFALKAAA